VIAKLSEVKGGLGATVHAVNAVQEEIGGYGAKMAAHRLRPDVCIVLDVTHATDTPGIDVSRHGDVKLGGGPSLTHGTANHPEVVKRLMRLAEKNRIPVQHEASSRHTGTDTDSIYHVGEGIPSALISLPQRYMHSAAEMVHLRDVEHIIELLTVFVLSVKASDKFAVQL
jgi:endoglucanase